MKIKLIDRSSKAINNENLLLLGLFNAELDKLDAVAFNELNDEYPTLFTPPTIDGDPVEFDKLTAKEKVQANFIGYLFQTNSELRKEYEYWKQCDLLGKETYYNFCSLELAENANLTYADFKKKLNSEKNLFIRNIGELQIDLKFCRTPDFIQNAFGQYFEYSSMELDKFVYVDDADKIIELLSEDAAMKLFGSDRYDVTWRRNLRKGYNADEVLHRRMRLTPPKRPLEKIEYRKQIMCYDVIYKTTKLL